MMIRTVEELAALPVGTIIRTASGTLVTRHRYGEWPWHRYGAGTRYSHAALIEYYGPIELVSTPDQPDLYLEAQDRIRVALALLDEADRWKPYDSRDTGETFLAESVRDLVAEVRAALGRGEDRPVIDRRDTALAEVARLVEHRETRYAESGGTTIRAVPVADLRRALGRES